jgi:IS5 family transposase
MDGRQTPLGAIIAPANEHEVRHIERLVDSAVVSLPEQSRLIYDKAADSDTLRDRLAERGVELICAPQQSYETQATGRPEAALCEDFSLADRAHQQLAA